MAIQVAIRHNTEYEFDRSDQVHPHVVRLRPAPHCRTPIKSYSLKVEPENHFVNWQQDPFGNHLARFVFPEKTRSLKFHVELVAEMIVINPFDFFLEESVEVFPFKYDKLSPNKRNQWRVGYAPSPRPRAPSPRPRLPGPSSGCVPTPMHAHARSSTGAAFTVR